MEQNQYHEKRTKNHNCDTTKHAIQKETFPSFPCTNYKDDFIIQQMHMHLLKRLLAKFLKFPNIHFGL